MVLRIFWMIISIMLSLFVFLSDGIEAVLKSYKKAYLEIVDESGEEIESETFGIFLKNFSERRTHYNQEKHINFFMLLSFMSGIEIFGQIIKPVSIFYGTGLVLEIMFFSILAFYLFFYAGNLWYIITQNHFLYFDIMLISINCAVLIGRIMQIEKQQLTRTQMVTIINENKDIFSLNIINYFLIFLIIIRMFFYYKECKARPMLLVCLFSDILWNISISVYLGVCWFEILECLHLYEADRVVFLDVFYSCFNYLTVRQAGTIYSTALPGRVIEILTRFMGMAYFGILMLCVWKKVISLLERGG